MTIVVRSQGKAIAAVASLAAVLTFAVLAYAADAPSLRIFYTASVKGYIDQCGCRYNPSGGIERRATYLEQNSRPSVPTLILDGGDVLGEDDEIGRMQTNYLFRAMKAMGYHALGVGPRDFLYGIGYLREAEQQHGFVFTSANVLDHATGRPMFAQYVIEEVSVRGLLGRPKGNLRVGVLSVMGTDRPPLALPSDPTARLLEPISAVRGVVEAIRAQTDVIVVMAYTNQAELDSIRAIGGVDVLISCRPLRTPEQWVSFSDRSAIGYSSFQGRGIGRIDASLSAAHTLTSAEGDLYMLTSDIPDNERMMGLKQEFEQWKARAAGDAH